MFGRRQIAFALISTVRSCKGAAYKKKQQLDFVMFSSLRSVCLLSYGVIIHTHFVGMEEKSEHISTD